MCECVGTEGKNHYVSEQHVSRNTDIIQNRYLLPHTGRFTHQMVLVQEDIPP